MKLKFHNKLEICVANKKYYVCYNTVLDTLYSKLSKLEPYFSYFALGNGVTEADKTSTTKLGNFVHIVKCETSEISCDPSVGSYYIKKTATLDSNDNLALSFSEIGIAADNVENPDIFNHILVKDQYGNVVAVEKQADESLELKLTIFLELDMSESEGLLTSGDNNLIKMLLGENIGDNSIFAVRGSNTSPNEQMVRPDVRVVGEKYEAEIKGAMLSSGEFELKITASLAQGETREIVLLSCDKPVARINLVDPYSDVNTTEKLTSSVKNKIVLKSTAKSIIGVSLADGTEVSDYDTKLFAKNFGDYVKFDEFDNFGANTSRYISPDGKTIAFVDDYSLHLYSCINYGLEKVHTGQIDITGIVKVCLIDNCIWVIKDISPYIEMYIIESGVAVRQTLLMQNYIESSYSLLFDDVCAIKLENNKYLLGVITSDSKSGIGMVFSYTIDGYILEKINVSAVGKTTKMLPVIASKNNNAQIIFITKELDNPMTSYALERVSENLGGLESYSQAQDFMEAQDVYSVEDYIVVKVDYSPYLYIYDIETLSRYTVEGLDNNDFSVSYDLSYIVNKDQSGQLKIYNSVIVELLESIEEDLILEFQDSTNVVFLDSVIMFIRQNDIKVLCLDKRYLCVQNLPSSLTDYRINYRYYNLLGSKPYEGVRLVLTLSFDRTV